jgi:hypothetical protein
MEECIRAGRGVEVAARGQVDGEVGHEQDGAEPRLRRCRGRAERRREDGRGRSHHHHQEGQSWEEASDPPCVEAPEVHAARGVELAEKQARDHEPGDYEEDIDAGEAAGHGQPGMEHHDQEHGDGPKALDVEPVIVDSPRCRRVGWRGVGTLAVTHWPW